MRKDCEGLAFFDSTQKCVGSSAFVEVISSKSIRVCCFIGLCLIKLQDCDELGAYISLLVLNLRVTRPDSVHSDFALYKSFTYLLTYLLMFGCSEASLRKLVLSYCIVKLCIIIKYDIVIVLSLLHTYIHTYIGDGLLETNTLWL